MESASTLGSPEAVAREIARAIEAEIPGARAEVTPGLPGHFEVRVVAEVFREGTRVEQHQRVYRAIAPLMEGERAPVHAIDRLETVASRSA